MDNLTGGLRRDTFDSCARILRIVDQTLLAVGSRLGRLNDRDAKELQRSVHFALCDAAKGVQKLFVGVPEAVDRVLSLIIVYAKPGESAILKYSAKRSVSGERRQSRIGAASDSTNVPKGSTSRGSLCASLDVTDPQDYPGRS